MTFNGTSPRAKTPWHVVVIVAEPLLWAVNSPSLLIVSTNVLSDCQSVQEVVMFCLVPSENVPMAIV
jgi:hypothetical protein